MYSNEMRRNRDSSLAASDGGGDAVMVRWLQSAGLQHLAAPLAAAALDHRLLPSLLMQDYGRYGVQSLEDKQKLFRLIKTINSGADSASAPQTPRDYSPSASNHIGMDGFLSPELRGDFNSGILDLHSIDDTEFFPEIAMPEPFQSSPFVPVIEKGFESDILSTSLKSRMQGGLSGSSPLRSVSNERDKTTSNNSLARIRVVVRKRPLNKKELSRKEEDIITINDLESSLTVNEPKVKVDLTAYTERHEFVFDAVLNQQVSNDEVYRSTVEPIVPTIFNRTKATCFAYGQTGSGKTYTMQPLPLRACEDIMAIMHQPVHRNQGLQLWLSFFEIYGGKLYDLLNERRKLCMREDGRQQVCIVGLKEFRVSDVELVKEYIDKGNQSRSTGSTGANEESSRSHAILQLVIKKAQEGKEASRVVGKISFIDLAGSERGADTTDNDRQTRMEGAEINKSLLALKECIRALDNDQGHIPFRGSKLTEVLRDSFVGDSRTVMISCISPNAGSCEHTLNTLRYADRVKGLSKNNNSKRDITATASLPRETNASPPPLPTTQVPEFGQDSKLAEIGKRPPLDPGRYMQQHSERELSSQPIEYSYSGREFGKPNATTGSSDRDHRQQIYADPENEPSFLDDPEDNIDSRVQGSSVFQSVSRRKVVKDNENFSGQLSKRQVDYSLDSELPSSNKLDGNNTNSRRQYDYEASKADGNNSRRQQQHEYNREESIKLDNSGNSRRSQYDSYNNGDELMSSKPDVVSNSRRQFEYNNNRGDNEVVANKPDVNSRRQFEYINRDEVSKFDGSSRRQFEYNSSRDEVSKPVGNDGNSRRQQLDQPLNMLGSQTRGDPEVNPIQYNHEGHINAILEEEEEVISAHRKEVEDTMEIVREEMKLLAEVDQPGSRIDRYVSQLNYVLSRKAAGIVNLQARLARFQRHLKEQEILTRANGLRKM